MGMKERIDEIHERRVLEETLEQMRAAQYRRERL